MIKNDLIPVVAYYDNNIDNCVDYESLKEHLMNSLLRPHNI
jgi:hypothetical protein